MTPDERKPIKIQLLLNINIRNKMAMMRQSKTNGTSFQDIPKHEYIDHLKLVRQLSKNKRIYMNLKEELCDIKKIIVNISKTILIKSRKTNLKNRLKTYKIVLFNQYYNYYFSENYLRNIYK